VVALGLTGAGSWNREEYVGSSEGALPLQRRCLGHHFTSCAAARLRPVLHPDTRSRSPATGWPPFPGAKEARRLGVIFLVRLPRAEGLHRRASGRSAA
jgi:hypothetical protein